VLLNLRNKNPGLQIKHRQGAWAIGCCIGPVLGGTFVEHTTWRWIFYVMFPFCLFGFVVIPPLLTLKLPKTTLKEQLLRVDWSGSFIFIASCTSFLIAVTWGGIEEPWNSFRTIVPLVLGAVGLVATGYWEAYCAREPFLRRSLFHCRSSYALFIGAMVQGLLVSDSHSFLPLLLHNFDDRLTSRLHNSSTASSTTSPSSSSPSPTHPQPVPASSSSP